MSLIRDTHTVPTLSLGCLSPSWKSFQLFAMILGKRLTTIVAVYVFFRCWRDIFLLVLPDFFFNLRVAAVNLFTVFMTWPVHQLYLNFDTFLLHLMARVTSIDSHNSLFWNLLLLYVETRLLHLLIVLRMGRFEVVTIAVRVCFQLVSTTISSTNFDYSFRLLSSFCFLIKHSGGMRLPFLLSFPLASRMQLSVSRMQFFQSRSSTLMSKRYCCFLIT